MRSDEAPLVSVGIPVFNGTRLIREAIDSVLSQEKSNFELVITDNRSTDETAAICKDYARRDGRVRYHRHAENIGLNRNFKSCVKRARGKYFCWLAHDDAFASPLFLAEQVKFLEDHPEVALCGSAVRIFDEESPGVSSDHVFEEILPDKEWKHARLDFFRWPQPPYHGLVIYGVFRREALLKVPAEGRDYRGKTVAMDMEYPILANLCRYGRIVALPDVLKLSRSVASSAACQQMENFSAFDYFWLALGMRLKILKIALRIRLPFHEKLGLLKVALGNFGRAPFGQRPRFTECLQALRREVAILRKTCAERLELIQKLDAELKGQMNAVQSLKQQLQKKTGAPDEMTTSD